MNLEHLRAGSRAASSGPTRRLHVASLAVLALPMLLLLCCSPLRPDRAGAQAMHAASQSGQVNTGNADNWDGRFFDGFGGTARGPFTLQGGRYSITVNAFFNDLHTSSSSCNFTGRLEGVEHPLPSEFADLGTAIPVASGGMEYDRSSRIIAPPGHYSLIVSPFTNCDWRVTIMGGIPAQDPLSIGPVGISHKVDGRDKTINVVPLGERVDFSMLYDVRDSSGPALSGNVSLIRRGMMMRTFPLTARSMVLGMPELARLVTFGTADRGLLGPLTARFTLMLGGVQRTRSFDFTLEDGAGTSDSGAVIISDLSVFSKVGDHYAATKVVHLAAETGFTVTYRAVGVAQATPTAGLSLLRRGKVMQTFQLPPITMDDGRTGFYLTIKWSPTDAILLGPLTARATVTLGATHASRSVVFTLAR